MEARSRKSKETKIKEVKIYSPIIKNGKREWEITIKKIKR